MTMSNIIPVILCGGSGTRLWPLSRENMPKQFLKLFGEESLISQTIERALKCSGAKPEKLMAVTLDSMKKHTIRELNDYDPNCTLHVLGEPCAKNTAAAIAYAALYAEKTFGRDAILWVLPADHYVGDMSALKSALYHAVDAAEQGNLVTFGIEASRPETGYGYIQMGDAYNSNPAVRHVSRFVEKPNRELAQSYLNEGNFVWNSGMFVFKVGTLIETYMQFAASILSAVNQAAQPKDNFKVMNPELYANISEVPFDVAIMEKAKNVAVVPCNPDWSDIGNWESVWEIREKDANGNAVTGKVACVETTDCLIQADTRLVAAVGVKDLVITEVGDAIMVADKKNPDAMKKMVKALRQSGARETIDPAMEVRPWGQFRVLSETTGYKIKEIIVNPGQKLSLQMHHHRCEFWTVISGEALVTIDDTTQLLKDKENIFIPLHAKHRLENPGTKDLVLVEVQVGNYLGEDDIVRFDDIYGRTAAA